MQQEQVRIGRKARVRESGESLQAESSQDNGSARQVARKVEFEKTQIKSMFSGVPSDP
jgi:hypothetical protein